MQIMKKNGRKKELVFFLYYKVLTLWSGLVLFESELELTVNKIGMADCLCKKIVRLMLYIIFKRTLNLVLSINMKD